MKDLRGLMNSIVPISEFSKGKGAKIIQQVNEEGREFIIVKNNEPQAVLLPIDTYNFLMDAWEQLKQVQTGREEIKHTLVSEEERERER